MLNYFQIGPVIFDKKIYIEISLYTYILPGSHVFQHINMIGAIFQISIIDFDKKIY